MGYPAFPTPQQVATQLASTSEFGVAEVDGTTITAAAGVLSAVAPSGMVTGPGASTVNDFALWNNTLGTLLKDATATVATSLLNLFTSSLKGLVPSSGGGTTNFLRADGTWAAPPSGLVYLGTVSTVSNAIVDQPSGTNILGANNATYRSFKLIFKNIIPGTTSILLLLQVHSGGAFQTSSYIGTQAGNVGGGFGQNTRTDSVPLTNSMANSTPGYSGEATVSGLSGTSAVKVWFSNGMYWNGSNAGIVLTGGFWNGGNGAIDGFQITSSSGNITSGSVDVYGVL